MASGHTVALPAPPPDGLSTGHGPPKWLPSRAAVWTIARAIGTAGDVHPHPGPDELRIAMANVTALRPHIQEVLDTKADVVSMVETRATEAGQRALGALAREADWQPIW